MSEREKPTSLTTMDKEGHRLWVYPQTVHGIFTRRREIVSYFLIIFYLVMPWLKVNGLPAIQLNIANRQFILLGSIYWPQDIKYLVFLLIAAGVALFLFTSVAGRIWCGWGCPQTVFLEFVFRKIEIWIEGERNQQMALDHSAQSLGKLFKKTVKHLIFIAIAAVVANTFLAYFVGTEKVLEWMVLPPTAHWGAFIFMMVNLCVFYFDFAWFREQFCTVICPYARIQSALTDENTLQVTYDFKRGEPRGHLNKAEGDCVDCGACVRVCPTGIDIRDGSQLECIGCARCIDACDEIMTKIKKPLRLVRYDSDARLENQEQHLIRPRVLIYFLLLVVLICSFFWTVSHRPLIEFNILRSPGEPYTVLKNVVSQHDIISNHFSLKILNKDKIDHQIFVRASGFDSAQLIVPIQPFPLSANSLKRLEIFLNVDQTKIPTGKHPITIQLFSNNQEVARTSSFILGPILKAE